MDTSFLDEDLDIIEVLGHPALFFKRKNPARGSAGGSLCV